MIELLPEGDERILAFRLSGTVSLDDYQAVAPGVTARFTGTSGTRVFEDWSALDGWTSEAESDRFLFRKAVGDRVERLAIVGEARWEAERARLEGLIGGEARLFAPSEREAAWAWLREGLD